MRPAVNVEATRRIFSGRRLAVLTAMVSSVLGGALLSSAGCSSRDSENGAQGAVTEADGSADARLDALVVSSSEGSEARGPVISQVYGGGGLTGATFNSDFVEIFNPTDKEIELDGLSLQYATKDGDFGREDAESGRNVVSLPSAKLKPGKYLTFALGGAADSGAPDVPADYAQGASDSNRSLSGSVDLASKAGKVALVRGDAPLSCGSSEKTCKHNPRLLDLVGYGGSLASDFEGEAGAAPELDAVMAAVRNGHGCADSDDNKADFSATLPEPRTADSPAYACEQAVTEDGGNDAEGAVDASSRDAASDADAGPRGPVLVISQVYGGGGQTGATYRRDYVEIFNPTKTSQVLSGLSLQYSNAKTPFKPVSGDAGSNFAVIVFPKDQGNDVTVGPGSYFLVAMAGSDTGPGADFEANMVVKTGAPVLDLDAKGGKVALVRGEQALGCGGPDDRCESSRIIDLVGYGADVSDYEGSGGAPALEVTKGAVRRSHGCQDTNDNAADFSAERVAEGAIVPHNSETVAACSKSTRPDDPGEDDPPPAKKAADAGKQPTVAAVKADGGCSTAPGPAGSGAAWGVVVAIGLMLRRRQARPRL